MDFPLFHFDFIGNRWLIAIIAIIHVLINHALAVGFIPIVTLLEYLGYKKKQLGIANYEQWDLLSYKLMKTGFIITTSVGAMTGVGIWFAASLANPASIGSLVRVFFGAWFTEWIVFVLEVVFIMMYFLSWKKSGQSQQSKRRHILFGGLLSIFSWFTMAIIVGILGFMMDTGSWQSDKTLFSGFLNPVYFPQLVFRTTVAMIMAGTLVLFLSNIMLKRTNPIQPKALRYICIWILVWSLPAFLGAYLYYYQIPGFMIGNLPVAIGTQAFQQWYSSLFTIMIIAIIIALLLSASGISFPKKLPRALLIVPVFIMFLFMGTFERIREFIRKPYVIGEYMYSNGLLVTDYPLYNRDGILKHATYTSIQGITKENEILAGKEIFKLCCTRCHTTYGVNSIVRNFHAMYGDKEFEPEAMSNYIKNMHRVRSYMPPFPGNAMELDAMVAYIVQLQYYNDGIEGAQTDGTGINNNHFKSLQ